MKEEVKGELKEVKVKGEASEHLVIQATEGEISSPPHFLFLSYFIASLLTICLLQARLLLRML